MPSVCRTPVHNLQQSTKAIFLSRLMGDDKFSSNSIWQHDSLVLFLPLYFKTEQAFSAFLPNFSRSVSSLVSRCHLWVRKDKSEDKRAHSGCGQSDYKTMWEKTGSRCTELLPIKLIKRKHTHIHVAKTYPKRIQNGPKVLGAQRHRQSNIQMGEQKTLCSSYFVVIQQQHSCEHFNIAGCKLFAMYTDIKL